ncbi:MAG: cupin domain-containing protein [Promethearchaeota archaeon]|jgi:quercetin dioxygenase-like cupin family protein
MIKKNYQDINEKQATLSDGRDVEGVTVRWLIDTNSGAKNFAMRRFEIIPGGNVPLHNHPEDHEIYILSGDGKFYDDKGKEENVKSGDVVYIPPNEKHGIDNLGNDNFVFICLVPYLKK